MAEYDKEVDELIINIIKNIEAAFKDVARKYELSTAQQAGFLACIGSNIAGYTRATFYLNAAYFGGASKESLEIFLESDQIDEMNESFFEEIEVSIRENIIANLDNEDFLKRTKDNAQ